MSGCRVVVHAANEVPQQGNTVDCGVFCVAMARCIAEGRAFDFNLKGRGGPAER